VDALFIHDERLASTSLGEDHPFKPARGRLTLDLCRREGLIDRPGVRIVGGGPCPPSDLERFHTAEYLDALRRANTGFHDDLVHYLLGRAECPVFPGVHDYAAGIVGATLAGVDALAAGEARLAFNPLGGMHHAMPANAEGFCYLNDAAVAIHRLADAGRRVAYLDIDAHHGNGVQHGFYERGDVLVVSVHESGRTLYPWSGFETEVGEGAGRGYTVNFPLPQETDDELFGAVVDVVVLPLLEAFAPDHIVVVMGMDTVAQDPLTHLKLTNNGVERCLRKVAALARPVLALGGGGYHLDSVTRGYTLGWAALAGFEIDDPGLALGGRMLGSAEAGGAALRDMQVVVTGDVRRRNVQECVRVEEYLRRTVFPIHGLG